MKRGAGESELSSSSGLRKRSKELEEAEVKAEAEEGDLFGTVDQEDLMLVVVALDSCSKFAEVASLFDVRRAVEAADRRLSAFWCGVYSPSESFLFLFLWVTFVGTR